MADASHNMAKQARQTGAAAGAGCVKPGALAWYADMPCLIRCHRTFPWISICSRTPDWYKPSLSSELKFRLRPTLKKEAYRAFPRFLLFAACAYVLQHPWNTNRDIGISKRQTLIADTGLSSLVHMASTISLHGAHDQQVGVGDRYCAVGTPRQRIADQAAVHDWGGNELHQSFMALHTRCSILGTQTETSASRSVRR